MMSTRAVTKWSDYLKNCQQLSFYRRLGSNLIYPLFLISYSLIQGSYALATTLLRELLLTLPIFISNQLRHLLESHQKILNFFLLSPIIYALAFALEYQARLFDAIATTLRFLFLPPVVALLLAGGLLITAFKILTCFLELILHPIKALIPQILYLPKLAGALFALLTYPFVRLVSLSPQCLKGALIADALLRIYAGLIWPIKNFSILGQSPDKKQYPTFSLPPKDRLTIQSGAPTPYHQKIAILTPEFLLSLRTQYLTCWPSQDIMDNIMYCLQYTPR